MAIADMLKNADKVSFNDIIMRQFAIGGINLTAYNPNKPQWRQTAVNERIAFLKSFFEIEFGWDMPTNRDRIRLF